MGRIYEWLQPQRPARSHAPFRCPDREAGPRAGLWRPFAGACAGGRARSALAGGLPVPAREGRGRPEAGGRAIDCGARGGGGVWPAERVQGGRRRGGGDAASSVSSADEGSALEPAESAEALRAGVGGFGRLPGHGGRGRWLPRQRCGPEPSEAGKVAVLTPAGPSRRYEAEPLPRPAAAAAAAVASPPGGWGSAGGRAAPTPAAAPASAAREAATGRENRALGGRRKGAGTVGLGKDGETEPKRERWGRGPRAGGPGPERLREGWGLATLEGVEIKRGEKWGVKK
jgi:hypothetical protein